MYFCKTICWSFLRIYMLGIGLNALATTYPTLFYPWRELDRLYQMRFPISTREFNQPIRTKYKLGIWSQYDNPEEGKAREGDIIERSGSRKTMTSNKDRLWPDGIVPYFIEDLLANTPEKLAILEDAMRKIMEATCLKFIRIYPESDGTFPVSAWVNITGNDQGCYSDLGRADVSPSILNLDVNRCFHTNGHAIHEILHTLGAFHEHMRPDRDKYIKILWHNIRKGDEFNFHVIDDNTAATYGLPYDYDSIMHYSMTAFAKDKSVATIIPQKEGAEIGQRDKLSFYDIQKLLITYKCNKADAKNPQQKLSRKSGENGTRRHSNTLKTARRFSRSQMSGNRPDNYTKLYTQKPWTAFSYPKYVSYRAKDYYH